MTVRCQGTNTKTNNNAVRTLTERERERDDVLSFFLSVSTIDDHSSKRRSNATGTARAASIDRSNKTRL